MCQANSLGARLTRPKLAGKIWAMGAKSIFATNLAAAMKHKRLSGGDIHRLTEKAVATSTVGRIVRGVNAPDLDTVTALSRAVGYQPWQLLVPRFDPADPPFLPRFTDEERALYDRLKSLLITKK